MVTREDSIRIIYDYRARLDAKPIRYEPGYESEAGDRTTKYNNTVRYGNWLYGVLQMLNQTPMDLKFFDIREFY